MTWLVGVHHVRHLLMAVYSLQYPAPVNLRNGLPCIEFIAMGYNDNFLMIISYFKMGFCVLFVQELGRVKGYLVARI